MNGKIARNICLFVWIIVSIYLIAKNVNNGIIYISLIAVGELLGIFGILGVFRKFSGWFFVDIGIVLYVFPILKILGVNINIGSTVKQIILAFCSLIVFELFFDDLIRNKNAKRRCTVPFEAKCISFAQAGESTYIPIYRYHIDGKTNMFYGNGLSSANPRLGEIITVFVNKKNENEIYCPTAKAILMLRYIFGFIILSFVVGTIIIL